MTDIIETQDNSVQIAVEYHLAKINDSLVELITAVKVGNQEIMDQLQQNNSLLKCIHSCSMHHSKQLGGDVPADKME